MNADSGEEDVPEAEAMEEDTRKTQLLVQKDLVALAQEREDIEADLDLTEETILVMMGALSAERLGISREIAQKWEVSVGTVVLDLHPIEEEEIALVTDQETDTEEKRESSSTLATLEVEIETSEREDLLAETDLLAIPNDEHPQLNQMTMF